MAYRKITELVGPYGTAVVLRDAAIPVEAGQWAVTTGGAIPSRWDGHSKAEALTEAARASGGTLSIAQRPLTEIVGIPAHRRRCISSLEHLSFWNIPAGALRVCCPTCERDLKVLNRGGHGQPRIPAHRRPA